MKKEILFLLLGLAIYFFSYRMFRTIENEILAAFFFITTFTSLLFVYLVIDNIKGELKERKRIKNKLTTGSHNFAIGYKALKNL